MRSRTFTVWAVLALVVLLAAACAPAVLQPTSAPSPTEVPATPTAAPATTAPATAEVVPATPDTRPIVPAPPSDNSRPLAAVPPAERENRFSGPAEPWVKSDTIYIATIVTGKGNIVAELYQDTPESLNNFVTLALNGFYDGLTFHRVEPGFVIQGGDPAGNGMGDPGYTIPAEIGHEHLKGALAWARTSDQVNPERRSSGSQFYITLDATPFLDGGYTVFGYVVEGMDVAEQIAQGDQITRIDISEGTVTRLPTPAPTPTPYPPAAQDGRPLAEVPVLERAGYYNAPPEVTLAPGKSYQATIKTAKGQIVIDLNADLAPISVNNFMVLANLGFYDGMAVAYAEPDAFFLVGSPSGDPGSDVGYRLPLEPEANASQIITGTVTYYPATDPGTGNFMANGSQFLITLAAVPEATAPLNVFGQVTEGMDVAAQLVMGDIIESITVSEK